MYNNVSKRGPRAKKREKFTEQLYLSNYFSLDVCNMYVTYDR